MNNYSQVDFGSKGKEYWRDPLVCYLKTQAKPVYCVNANLIYRCPLQASL